MTKELDKIIEQEAQKLFTEKLVKVLTRLGEEIIETKALVTDIVKILEDHE